MNKAELALKIRQCAAISGTFKLRSGQSSDHYFDKYRFESDPALLSLIAEALSERLPTGIDKLAALEMGGIPIGTAISLKTGIPCLFVRKEPKSYGTCNQIEGGFTAGDKVVIVEDIVTSGGAVLNALEAIRDAKLTVEHVLCVIDRNQTGREKIEACNCTMSSLFTSNELE